MRGKLGQTRRVTRLHPHLRSRTHSPLHRNRRKPDPLLRPRLFPRSPRSRDPSRSLLYPNMNISLVAATRTRPQSIDTAVVLPTPIHAGSFSSQQDTEISARGSPKIMDTTAVPSAESVQNVLRRDDPSRERQGGKEKEPSFDFQKFLDQMKTKVRLQLSFI